MIAAITAAIVLVVIAVYRDPVPVGQGREMLIDLFKIGSMLLFCIFLFSYVDVLAGTLFILGFFYSLYPYKSPESLNAFHLLLYGLGWYAALICLFKYHPNLINYTLCVIAIIHTLVIFKGYHLMTNPNEESAILALCCSSFLLFKHWLPKLLIAIPIIGIFHIHCFNGMLAVAVILTIYGIYCLPHIWYIIIYLFFSAIIFYWNEIDSFGSVQIRLSWWIPALKGFWHNPMGCGIGNWKRLSGILVNAGKIPNGCLRLHNTWIENAVEMGIPFIGYVLLYITYLISHLKKIHIAHILGIVSFIIVGCTNSVMRMNIINGMIIICLLARVELEIRKEECWNGKDESACIV